MSNEQNKFTIKMLELLIKPRSANCFRVEYGDLYFDVMTDVEKVAIIYPSKQVIASKPSANSVYFEPIVSAVSGDSEVTTDRPAS